MKMLDVDSSVIVMGFNEEDNSHYSYLYHNGRVLRCPEIEKIEEKRKRLRSQLEGSYHRGLATGDWEPYAEYLEKDSSLREKIGVYKEMVRESVSFSEQDIFYEKETV